MHTKLSNTFALIELLAVITSPPRHRDPRPFPRVERGKVEGESGNARSDTPRLRGPWGEGGSTFKALFLAPLHSLRSFVAACWLVLLGPVVAQAQVPVVSIGQDPPSVSLGATVTLQATGSD
jgi:hypothetical protein